MAVSTSLVTLWIIVIVLFILVIVGLIYYFTRPNSQPKPQPWPNTNCEVATNLLESLDGIPCCNPNQILTNQRFVPQLNMVVQPSPTNYIQACSGYCANGISIPDNSPAGRRCQTGPSDNFINCLDQLRPKDCIGPAMPVAYDGIVYYYGFAVGNQGCQTTAPCAPTKVS